MKLRTSDLDISDSEPFKSDALKRSEHVNAFADLLVNLRDSAVVSVTSPWGTGKTTFIRMLRGVLKSRNVHTLHFNAWQSDFTDDPFVALVAEIGGYISGHGKPGDSKAGKRLAVARHIGVQVAKRSLPTAVKLATAGILNLDDFTEDAISSLAERSTDDAISNHDQSRKTIERFRDALSKYVSEVRCLDKVDDESRPPLIFIVDELDRCRPPYAISLLEKIKHLFNVPGLLFVLAIDDRQLGHALRSVYGACMDVDGYLRRLIDFDYKLPPPAKGQYCAALFARYGLDEFFAGRTHPEMAYDKSSLEHMLGELFEVFSFSLRQQEQCFARLAVVCRLTSPNQRLFANPLAILMVLRMADHDLYSRYVSGEIDSDAVIKRIESTPAGKRFLAEHVGLIAEACLIACMRDEHASSIIKKYQDRSKDPKVPQAERSRLAEVLEVMPRLSGINRSPLEYLLKRIEVAQRFQ